MRRRIAVSFKTFKFPSDRATVASRFVVRIPEATVIATKMLRIRIQMQSSRKVKPRFSERLKQNLDVDIPPF